MNVIRSFSVSILIILFSSYSIAQLDSVWYQGPSVGSVTSGAMQTTDNFSVDFPLSSGEFKINPPIDISGEDYRDMISNWDESLLPEYVYVDDLNTSENPAGADGKTVLLNSFPGISMTNFIPPDPVIAAGPDHIIVCVNSIFRIYDKEGNILKTIPADEWWDPVWPEENGDPQVVYDHYEERWILVWMQVNGANQTAGNLIAYSDDDNPLGDWYMYRLDTKMHGTVPSNTWGDYPKVGFDEEAIYIMTRHIAFSGGHQYNKIRIIGKSELYNSNAGPLTYTDIWDIRKPGEGASGPVLDCIHPGISYTQGSGAWFFWARGIYGGAPVSADFYAIYKITNPLTSPGIRGKVLPVQTYTSPPLANQLGGGLGLETIGWITRAPIIRDGFLYASHDIQNSTNSNYSSVKYLKVDLSTISISEQLEYGAIGYFYLFPALTIDQDNNIAVTFSRSADTEYVGAYYTTKHANDTVGFKPSQPIVEGQGNYVVTYSGTINRWGDYFGIYLDPENFYDVWMFTEYAASTNVWGTYVGQIRMVPYQGIFPFVAPSITDFGDVEVNTTSDIFTIILSNYGEDDLVILGIDNSVGPFNLVSNFSYPFPISSYDSVEVEVSFAPTVAGNYDEILPVTSNDPGFAGFHLKGHGYDMLEASSNIFYASTGAGNDGNIFTVDMQTGAGVLLGPSLFSEVTSLTVNPGTNIMLGLITGSSQSELVRVNAGGGDSYKLLTIELPALSGIAFNSSGTLYACRQTGEIYTIDLTTGNSTLVATANIQIHSIAFHPTTNVLWAAKWKVIGTGKDEIYTIDLSSGNATLIGETGFAVITNDLAFDVSDNLYGIYGAAHEIGSLISISTSDATGTLIGETGFTHITGLGYSLNGPPAGVNDNVVVAPKEFALQQNYPNPFNSGTKIRFTISDFGFTILKVYDILGREVVVLMNEEKPAGSYEVEFNGANLTSGIYFYQLRAGNFVESKKMILLK